MTDTLFDTGPTWEPTWPTFLDQQYPCEIDMARSDEWGHAIAVFSVGREHRYLCARMWDPDLPVCTFIMLNPSTADAFKVDPTVNRCLRFARAWGAGTLLVLNIFALRSTDPRALYAHRDPIGAHNDDVLRALGPITRAHGLARSRVIAAWGTHGAHLLRGAQVRHLLAEEDVDVEALRFTKDGFPNHPLYLPASTEPVPFPYL